jgi:hypothetical protein
MDEERCLRFVPSRVDGLRDITEVAIYPDRLAVRSAERWNAFHFADLAVWPRPAFLWRQLARYGWRPHWLPVGERDWCHSPSERFFRFYTQPRLVIYLPDEPREIGYADTLFRRIQDVMLRGGFNTWDLG